MKARFHKPEITKEHISLIFHIERPDNPVDLKTIIRNMADYQDEICNIEIDRKEGQDPRWEYEQFLPILEMIQGHIERAFDRGREAMKAELQEKAEGLLKE